MHAIEENGNPINKIVKCLSCMHMKLSVTIKNLRIQEFRFLSSHWIEFQHSSDF